MFSLMERLYPYCRSVTGEGVRDTIREIKKIVDIEMIEVPSGTVVYDWIVPNEWKVNKAFLSYENGEKILDVDCKIKLNM